MCQGGKFGFCAPLGRTATGAGWDVHPTLQPGPAFPSLLLHQAGLKSSQTGASPHGTLLGGCGNLSEQVGPLKWEFMLGSVPGCCAVPGLACLPGLVGLCHLFCSSPGWNCSKSLVL